MLHWNLICTLVGSVFLGALGLFLATILLGVPYVMFRACRLGLEGKRELRRLNRRLFRFAYRIHVVMMTSFLLYLLLNHLRSG